MRKKRRVNIHFSKKKVIRICIVVPLMCCALSFCIHNYADAFGGLCYCFHCRLNRVGHRVIEADKKIETAEVATLVNEFRTLYNDFWDTGSVPMDGLSHMSRYDGLHSLSFQDTDSLTRRIGNHYDSLAHGSSDIQSSPETGADVYTQATQGNTLDDVPAQGLYPYLTDMDFPATQRDMVAAYYNQTKVTGKGDIRGENEQCDDKEKKEIAKNKKMFLDMVDMGKKNAMAAQATALQGLYEKQMQETQTAANLDKIQSLLKGQKFTATDTGLKQIAELMSQVVHLRTQAEGNWERLRSLHARKIMLLSRLGSNHTQEFERNIDMSLRQRQSFSEALFLLYQ